MDSLTQIVLGASVAEATVGRKAGNKAMLWGAVAATIPDLDIVTRFIYDVVDHTAFHRSMTHSIFFFVLLAPLMGLAIRKIHPRVDRSWRQWAWMSFLVLLTHALLDCFTTWGTQLFWPFSDYMVAFRSIFVIDPLYTVPFLICVVWAACLRRTSRHRQRINAAGLLISTMYLGLTLVNKHMASQNFEQAMQQQEIAYTDYQTRPTLFNNVLWSVTAETDSGFHIGYYSFFDSHTDIPFQYFPKRDELLAPWRAHPKVQKLLRITGGYYTVEQRKDTLVLNDLRFGQSVGWDTGEGAFVFSYYLLPLEGTDDLHISRKQNTLQEGSKLLPRFWERVKGV